jgi:predicted nucleic acid-binding protein
VTYLVDTDRVVEHLKGRPDAIELITRLAPEGLAISVIKFGEIYEGIHYGRDPKRSMAGFRQFLVGVRVLNVTQPIARRFAIIRGDLRSRGMIIAQPDILIAATAIHHDLTLVTGNRRHFARIPGLALL